MKTHVVKEIKGGCIKLANILKFELNNPSNILKAIDLYTNACEKGKGNGCSGLGSMYFYGLGVAKDQKKGIRLYQKGCKEHYGSNACLNFGNMYYHGIGVEKNLVEAEIHWGTACAYGSGEACAKIAIGYQQGILGGTSDNFRATRYFTMSCDWNYPLGCSSLGVNYLRGKGVRQDKHMALSLFKKACDSNDELGCFNLGTMYQYGQTIPKDIKKAKEIFGKLCDQGSELGCEYYAKINNTQH